MTPLKRVIHWFRRDLRVADNTALAEAGRRAELVIPVFVLEDALKTGRDVGAARLAFLLQSLRELGQTLANLGYDLIVRQGRSEVLLPALCREFRAEAVFCNRRYEPYAQARDHRVFNALNRIGVGFEIVKDAVVWEERELLTQAEQPYTVFTPYAKTWRSRKIPKPVPSLKARAPGHAISFETSVLDPAEFGHPSSQTILPAGEKSARQLIQSFFEGPVFSYGKARDFPALDGTSHLSAHLRCGTIGIRTVLTGLAEARDNAPPAGRPGCDTFLNELIWREFYLQILANFPHVMKGSFRPEYDVLAWSDNQQHFDAWCAGQTGYPLIDAAMRCLNATAWMHNRLRMATAMFLTKDLLTNWQQGERHFMKQLVDGDMAANNGGWQWAAGTGTDAAPYFRIFNPVTQSQKFDPEGEFIRKWVPELAGFRAPLIHEPWKDQARLKQSGYPERIVQHEAQRPKCLAMYERARNKTRRSPRAL